MIPFTEDRENKTFFQELQKRYEQHKNNHRDTVIVVVGEEQTGKSRWTLRTEWCLDKSQFYKNGEYDLSKIVFHGEDFLDVSEKTHKGIVHFDEAVRGLYSRNAMSQINTEVNKDFQTNGFRHNIIFLCIPDFFSIDSYIKKFRCTAIVRIFEGNKFKVYYFKKPKVKSKKLGKILKEKAFNVRPSSTGWWTESNNSEEYNRFFKLYKEKEKKEKKRKKPAKHLNQTVKKNILKDIVKKSLENGTVSQKDIAKKLGISVKSVWRYANDIETKRTTGG